MTQSDSLLEVYIYENLQLLEQLESILLSAEKEERFTSEEVDAVFRVLHTIKGSSAMMGFDGLTHVSHAMEDLFACIRADRALAYDQRRLCALAFNVQDFLKSEIEPLQEGATPGKDPQKLLAEIDVIFQELKGGGTKPASSPASPSPASPAPASPTAKSRQAVPSGGSVYRARIVFEKGCMMENVRAFGVVKSVENLCSSVATVPADVLCDGSDVYIVENGFIITMVSSAPADTLREKIAGNFFIASLDFEQASAQPGEAKVDGNSAPVPPDAKGAAQSAPQAAAQSAPQAAAQKQQSFVSVRLDKLDKLMELVGELVITESILTKNPEVLALRLDSFEKGARQLRKLTDELQDAVMSTRMLPISTSFHRLERILRDVCVKTDKKAELIIRGEDTEMDKSVIDSLGDPLMHIIRNAIDHGIEMPEERVQNGKLPVGRVTIEAESISGEVVISASDDGRGLDRAAILKKATERGLLKKNAQELSDSEVYALVFEPGFSTSSVVTEFSGRGVGMDVVRRDLEKIGGNVSIESAPGKGMTVRLRIPQTLAIIECMQVSVGAGMFLIPLPSITKSFQPTDEVVTDPDGKELALLRGKCYPIMRLHRKFAIPDALEVPQSGILVQVNSIRGGYCLLVDRLLGEQQTVVKPLPAYVTGALGAQKGISGCTILGDGSVGLILDVNSLME